VIAVASALVAVLTGVASGAGPEQGTVVLVKLELKASNGQHAHLENSEDGIVTLELRKEGQIVTYNVRGEATEAGLKARFGRLGLIDVAFTPTTTLTSTEPGEGCTGAPRTLREGVFAGTIAFAGEREFVRIEGPEATGSMSVISQWECPEIEGWTPLPVSHASWRRPLGARGSKENQRRCSQGVAVAPATSSLVFTIVTAVEGASSWASSSKSVKAWRSLEQPGLTVRLRLSTSTTPQALQRCARRPLSADMRALRLVPGATGCGEARSGCHCSEPNQSTPVGGALGRCSTPNTSSTNKSR